MLNPNVRFGRGLIVGRLARRDLNSAWPNYLE